VTVRRIGSQTACFEAGKREERVTPIRKCDPMRALFLGCLVSLAGCIIDNDPLRVENFAVDTPQTFSYGAQTNTVMTANDDGAAERIRRDWLAEALSAHAMCGAGYVIETRRFVQPSDGLFGNGGDVVYTGRCL
jgi:hypothetical protein